MENEEKPLIELGPLHHRVTKRTLNQYRFEEADEEGLGFVLTLLKRRYPEAYFIQTAGTAYVTLVTNLVFTDSELGYLRGILDMANTEGFDEVCVEALEKVMP